MNDAAAAAATPRRASVVPLKPGNHRSSTEGRPGPDSVIAIDAPISASGYS
jgi:hypothetical protein